MGSRYNKDPRRRQRSPSPDEEDELFGHIQCFVPSANIDVAVLAKYLREFIDDTVTIRQATNPTVGILPTIDQSI
jgi:hypothetical protein